MKIDKIEKHEFTDTKMNPDGFYMVRNGITHYVPNDPSNIDYQEIDKQVKEGKMNVDKVKIN